MSFNIPKIEYGGLIPTTISFTYPPIENSGEISEAKNHISTSLAGVRQISTDYIEVTRKLNFSHITESLKVAMESFFRNHAGLGKSFRYFDDKNGVSYTNYELADFKFDPKRIASAGANVFFYSVQMVFRRVLGSDSGDCMSVSLVNNQASPLDIGGLLFSSADVRTAELYCEIYRKTDSNERVFRGKFAITYKTNTSAWDISQVEGVGDDPGVTLSILSTGQIQYTTDSMSGSNYTGYIEFKELILC